jgi:SAM-dependent methyltransferase
MNNQAIEILCKCGGAVALTGEKYVCACGETHGELYEGVARLGKPTPYWGEIPQASLRDIIADGKTMGWRSALDKHLPKKEQHRITDVTRAAFKDILPLRDGSRVLDIGSGLGLIATELAQRYQVTAMEGVWERARLTALRGEQDGLHNLFVINGDINNVRLKPGQFDAIIVNGVLEWVGLFDLSRPPEQVQQTFLEQLRDLLAPGGLIYLAIENRIGLAMFLGTEDHSGRKYTSLMPRFMARWVCSRDVEHRAESNLGYRTYTYSYWGYSQLFERSGLRIKKAYVPRTGYITPTELIPISKPAIDFYCRTVWLNDALTWKSRLWNGIKVFMSKPFFWRLVGDDFSFLIESKHA